MLVLILANRLPIESNADRTLTVYAFVTRGHFVPRKLGCGPALHS